MGFFHYDFENSKGRISISEQTWVYLALALPLTVLTLGLSYAWIWWTDKEQKTRVLRRYFPYPRKKWTFPFSLFTRRNTYPIISPSRSPVIIPPPTKQAPVEIIVDNE